MIDDFKKVKYHGYTFYGSKQAHYGVYLQRAISRRIGRKQATNITVTGEAGIGKSYTAITIARVYEGFKQDTREGTTAFQRRLRKLIPVANKKKLVPVDRLSVDQIVFTHSEYMKELQRKRMGRIIIFDEPSYAMGKRDWFKSLNKALIQTLESQRFLIRPLIIPIINMSLLDKTIRSHLVQYHINLTKRGFGHVYRISNNPFKDQTYNKEICSVTYPDYDHIRCQISSCLDCKYVGDPEKPDPDHDCGLLVAQYERKKKKIQYERYDQARSEAEVKESLEYTEEQLEEICMDNIQEIMILKDNDEQKISIPKMRLYLRSQGIRVNQNKAYRIKANLELLHPDKTT